MLCKNLSIKKSVNRLRTSSTECYHRQMAWCRQSDNRNQKSHIAVEKASSSSSKGEWRTYSAHFLLISWLIIRPNVKFRHSLRTSGNANDEPLAKTALWHVKLFCLYHSYFRNVLGENSYTYLKMFDHYIHAFMLIHFDYSAEWCMQMFETFFCATRYNKCL